MVKHIDHVTVVVRDVEKAKEFFGTISGEKFEKYMGVPVQGPHLSPKL